MKLAETLNSPSNVFLPLLQPSRLMLAAGGIEYEDVRVTFEEWPKIKDSEETKKKPQTIFHKKHKFLSFSFHNIKKLRWASFLSWSLTTEPSSRRATPSGAWWQSKQSVGCSKKCSSDFLAFLRRAGLYGAEGDEVQQARVDAAFGFVTDFVQVRNNICAICWPS